MIREADICAHFALLKIKIAFSSSNLLLSSVPFNEMDSTDCFCNKRKAKYISPLFHPICNTSSKVQIFYHVIKPPTMDTGIAHASAFALSSIHMCFSIFITPQLTEISFLRFFFVLLYVPCTLLWLVREVRERKTGVVKKTSMN